MNINTLHPDASPPRRLMRGAAAAPLLGGRPGGACDSPIQPGFPGFTLIELLLVMALLAIVVAISIPSLGPFFRGRNLDSEARRLLALTRHGQSRAVSEGIPMLLWVDSEKKAYGLECEPGWDEKDPKAVEFRMDRDLQIEIVRTNLVQRRLTAFELLGKARPDAERSNLPEIRFLPDGSIDDSSPSVLTLTGRDGAKVSVAQATNRLNYEIARASK
jgi:type II secretion system protein H